MPFAIVQTLSARGRKELSAVPKKWLDTSIQGDILLWPKVKSSNEQAKLLRDENSTPSKSWLKYECRIKRKNIPSYDQAALVIDEMSGYSSSDVSMVPRKRKKINKTAPANFQNMLNFPSVEPSSQITITPHQDVPPKLTNASPANKQNAPIMKTAGSPPRFQSCPKKTSKIVLPANITTPVSQHPKPSNQNQDQHSSSHPNMTATAATKAPLQPILIPAASNFNQPYFEFDPSNIDIPETFTVVGNPQSASENSIQQCVDYLKQLINMQRTSDTMIDARFSSLEKRLAHQSTQIEFIMDALRYRNDQDGTTEVGRIEPIDDSRKLEDLEKSLQNESYRSNLMRWLRVNVSGDCADNRMMCVLDLIMTKKFQAQCTWTGSSRKGPKVPVMVHQRILKVFEEIGTSDTEIVTQHKLANFFMKKLKNAGKRLKSAGIRRSSRHVVKKRKTKRGETNYRSEEQDVDNMEEQVANQNSDNTLEVNDIQGTHEIQIHQNTMATENSKPNESSELIDEDLVVANAPFTEHDKDSVSSNDTYSAKEVSSDESTLSVENGSSDDNIDTAD